MRYPTVEEVAQINADLTGAVLLRDAGLLASAVGRPSQTAFGADAYPDLYTKIAALFESLACNHAFVDGNKRTAVVAAIHMLNWNGFDLIASDTDVVDVAVAVARHQLDLPKLAELATPPAARRPSRQGPRAPDQGRVRRDAPVGRPPVACQGLVREAPAGRRRGRPVVRQLRLRAARPTRAGNGRRGPRRDPPAAVLARTSPGAGEQSCPRGDH